MPFDVVWVSYHDKTPNKGYWDFALPEAVTRGELWRPVGIHQYQFRDSLDDVPKASDGAILLIPARYHANDSDRINEDIARFKWVVIFLLGDEEGLFDCTRLKHPNMRLWVMSPRKNRDYPEWHPVLG